MLTSGWVVRLSPTQLSECDSRQQSTEWIQVPALWAARVCPLGPQGLVLVCPGSGRRSQGKGLEVRTLGSLYNQSALGSSGSPVCPSRHMRGPWTAVFLNLGAYQNPWLMAAYPPSWDCSGPPLTPGCRGEKGREACHPALWSPHRKTPSAASRHSSGQHPLHVHMHSHTGSPPPSV